MATTTDISILKINYLTQAQYDTALANNQINANELYLTPAAPVGSVTSIDISNATNGGLTISGGPVTTSGTITIGHSNVLSSAQTTQAIYPIKIDKNGHISAYGTAVTPLTSSSTLDATKLSGTIPASCYTNTNTTYTLSGALSSHKFTSTLTAGGSGSGTSTSDFTLAAGTGITITDDTSNRKMTIACSVTNTDEKVITEEITTSKILRILGVQGESSAGRHALHTATALIGMDSDSTATSGNTYLQLGNSTASGTAGSKAGCIFLYGSGTNYIKLNPGTLSSDVTLTLPNTTGTIALTSNITDTKVSTAAVTSGTTYYPVVGADTTSAATKFYDKTGIVYKGTNGTTSAVGSAVLTLGNSTASGTANNKQGQLVLYGSTAYAHTINGAPTAARTLTLPNATGTIALTSDIPDVSGKIDTAGTGLSKSSTTLNHSNSVTAQTTQAIYPIKIDAQGHISAYGTAVTPLTASSTLDATKLSGTIPTSCYTNTTYTFANGTNCFTITPSGGTAQTVTVTPSLTAADVGAVPTSRTVNGKALSTDISLDVTDFTTLTTVTVNVTTTTGTYVSSVCRRYGQVIQLTVGIRNTAAVASGSDFYVGTFNTALPAPVAFCTTGTYFSKNPVMASLSTGKVLTVRNCTTSSVTIGSSNTVYVTFTYLTTD